MILRRVGKRMSTEIIKKLIIASNVYFWGTEEVDAVSLGWYTAFLLTAAISFVTLILVWLI